MHAIQTANISSQYLTMNFADTFYSRIKD